MDTDAFIRKMFETDSYIRSITIVNNEFHVLASKQREGVPSYTTEEQERNFMSIMPPIVMHAVEKLCVYLREMDGFTAHFRKALLVFYRSGAMIVVISFKPQVGTPFYERITMAFKEFSAQYLKG